MTATDRLCSVLGVLDHTLPYWFRRATSPLAYALGFLAGLIDIVGERRSVTTVLSAAPHEGRENPPT